MGIMGEKRGRAYQWPVFKHLTLSRWIYLTMVLIAVLVIFPPKIPIPITEPQQAWYNEFMKIPPGSVIVMGFHHADSYVYDSFRDSYQAMMKLVCGQRLKFIIHSIGVASPQAAEDMVRRANIEKVYGYKYGIDYVITPYMAGDETAMAAFAADIPGSFATDNRGNPTKSLPLMQEVKTMNDVYAATGVTSFVNIPPAWVRQWPMKYPKLVYLPMGGSGMEAYYGTYVKGILPVGAQMEYFAGMVGEETLKLTGVQASHVLTTLLVIANGIKFNLDRLRAKEKAPKGGYNF